jgi:hypothetical protein
MDTLALLHVDRCNGSGDTGSRWSPTLRCISAAWDLPKSDSSFLCNISISVVVQQALFSRRDRDTYADTTSDTTFTCPAGSHSDCSHSDYSGRTDPYRSFC